jgi:hypothetical protein
MNPTQKVPDGGKRRIIKSSQGGAFLPIIFLEHKSKAFIGIPGIS